jgi:hypothetical protein
VSVVDTGLVHNNKFPFPAVGGVGAESPAHCWVLRQHLGLLVGLVLSPRLGGGVWCLVIG